MKNKTMDKKFENHKKNIYADSTRNREINLDLDEDKFQAIIDINK